MQLLLSLLIAYTALTIACYYPLNESRFANGTLLAEYIANMTAENPDVSPGSSDWLTIIGKGETDTHVWPIPGTDGPKEVAIPYCFPTQKDSDVLTQVGT
jgi:hypothetical protein